MDLLNLSPADLLMVGATAAGFLAAYAGLSRRSPSAASKDEAGPVDDDAWVYMQDEGAGEDGEDDPIEPYSPVDARRDSAEWNRTMVELEGSFDEAADEDDGGAAFDPDDAPPGFGSDGEAGEPGEPSGDEEGEASSGSGSGSRRRNLRKLHRRSWTHTNLDGTTEARLHKRESPYKDGKNTRIVRDY